MTLLVHRLAAMFLRLRGKRPPLEDMISAWSGGRWHMGCYETTKKPTPSAATEAA